MTGLTIYKDTDVDSTVISNLFIDEYMGDANDAQIKVYLYLLRMMNAHKAVSVSSIADKFNHTEKEVLRALKYWEKRRLLNLDFDENKNLESIHIHDLVVQGRPEDKTPDSSPEHSTFSPEVVPTSVTFPMPTLQVETEKCITKPSYSADQLREFRKRKNTEQLIFVAENYLGKPLSPSEMKSILFYTDELHFSDDLIDHLLQYCIGEMGKKSFHYIDQVAISWAKEGITTPEQAVQESLSYNKQYYAFMKALGRRSDPTPAEAEYFSRWVNQYGFEDAVIFEACKRAVLYATGNRLDYAEGTLKKWYNQQVHHVSDISAADETFRKKNGGGKPSAKKSSNAFAQFEQRDYDFDAIEEKLLDLSGKQGD